MRGLFANAYALADKEAYDVVTLEAFLRQIATEFHKNLDSSDLLADRLDRAQSTAAGLELSKQKYHKRFRLLQRIEKKLGIKTSLFLVHADLDAILMP